MSDTLALDDLLGHDPFMQRLARTLVRDGDAAADVAQEAWKNAMETGAPAVKNPRGWLGQVVRNAVRSQRRGAARRDLRERVAARPEALPSAAEVAQREALRRDLIEAVLALAEPHRTAVLLRFYEGLPPRTIAKRTGAPVETVRSRIRTGLDRLKSDLDAHRPRASWLAGLVPFSRRPVVETGSAVATITAAALVVALGVATWSLLRAGDDVSLDGTMKTAIEAGVGNSPAPATPAIETDRFIGEDVTIVSALEHDGLYADCEPINAAGTRRTWTTTVVVDAVTGEPIKGVRVSAHIEPHCAIPDRWEPVREVKTDDHGWARMRLDDLPDPDVDWWFYTADGYAPYAHFSTLMEFPIRLHRGIDVPIVVRDHQDRPLGGAKVGLILGCGHTPNVRRVTTDADGRALLPNVTPGTGELWPLMLGFESSYADLDAWRPGWPAQVIRMEPGMALIGRITDHLSRPVPFAYVGSPQCHRGPWTRADANGQFELAGADFGSAVHARRKEREHEDAPLVISDHVASGVTRIIKATKDTEDVDEVMGPRFRCTVKVTADGDPVAGILVRIVRSNDGMAFDSSSGSGGNATFSAPAGRYVVATRSPSMVDRWTEAAEALVIEDEGATGRAEVERLREVRFSFEGWQPTRKTSIDILGDDRLVKVDVTKSLRVPVERPLRLRIAHGGPTPRFIEVKPDAEGRCVIPAPPTRTLRVALQTPEGRPAGGLIEVVTRNHTPVADPDDAEGEERSTYEVTIAPEQDLIVYATPADTALAPVAVALDADAISNGILPIKFERNLPLVTVEESEWGGSHSLFVAQDGLVEEASHGRVHGGFAAIRPGTRARAVMPNAPGRTFIVSDTPTTIRWPDAALIVEAVDSSGKPIPVFEVFLGDLQVTSEDGRATIRGITVGRHVIHVGAPGMLSWTLEVEINDEAGGTIRVVQTPRN